MATLRKRTTGCWELQYRDEHRRKQTITLSDRKYKERIVKHLKEAVEVLVDKRLNNDPRQDPTVKAWVENAPPDIQIDHMRASRSSEIYRDYGAIAESAWLGHSEKVATECYLKVTDED